MDLENYKATVEAFFERLNQISETQAGIKLSAEKWSLKEIMGHLIDSASNNHQRFVRLHFGDLLDFPAYDGEQWVTVEKINQMQWSRIISLWYHYNCLLLNIIENVDSAALGNVWVKGEDAIPLGELIVDYFRHLKLHMEHFENRLKGTE